MMFENYPDLVTTRDLMIMLDIGKDKAYYLINSGEIASFRIGRRNKIPKREVINYINHR